MTKYNDKGEELCNEGLGHEFERGVCTICSAPEGESNTEAAIQDFYKKEDQRLQEKYAKS